ncbi:MAG TPA: hypothetical protein PKC89_06490 [Pyrinomonadaceae bacterium]|nr:hypothetical protein [Pyrinomonadaceae bacterium]
MLDLELKASNLHWLLEGNPHGDCCVHGGVFLRLGEYVISSGDVEWTVSTAAFNLLRTVFHDHRVGENVESLIPCCGFNMWPIESAPDGLYIPNCSNGIDWDIRHEGRLLMHRISTDKEVCTQLLDWTRSVCDFADEVHNFFYTAWPKNISREEDKKGFELFMSLWNQRRAAAQTIINAG